MFAVQLGWVPTFGSRGITSLILPSLRPGFVVADEATAALDVSIQAQIVNLLVDLKASVGLSYLFISHNLAVVRHISDRVAIMYLGHLMEVGSHHDIYENPTHPYSQALLSAVPVPDPATRGSHQPLTGDLPSPMDPPKAAGSIPAARWQWSSASRSGRRCGSAPVATTWPAG